MNLFDRTKNTLQAYIHTHTWHAFEVGSGFRFQETADGIKWNPGGHTTTWFPAERNQILEVVRGVQSIEAADHDKRKLSDAYHKLVDRLNAVYEVRFTVDTLIGGDLQLGFQGIPGRK